MDIQRLRSLTTGRLHTEIGHVYEDIETITDIHGLMTYQLPNVLRALEPWLIEKVSDEKFWRDEFDPTHVGEFDLPQMTDNEKQAFISRYKQLPSPLEGKTTVAVVHG